MAHVLASSYQATYSSVFGPFPDLSDTVRFPAVGKPGDPAWEAMNIADQETINHVFASFGKAIAAYERTLVSADSHFDRFMAGDEGALSDAALRGARLFVGRASCNECHRGPNLSDGRFHNLGVPQIGAFVPELDRGRVDGVPIVTADPFNRAGAFSDDPASAFATGLEPTDQDVGSFKTPTLRSVVRTAPYMHNGSIASLREVVLFYRQGGGSAQFSGTKSPKLRELRLSGRDIDDLVAFLEALDGADLPEAITSAPVLP